MSPVDWLEWHRAYDDPANPLYRRLQAVRRHVRAALDAAPPGPLRAVSICAGQGADLIGALAGHPRAADVRARLVELDPRNAAAADPPPGVEFLVADAGSTDAYAGAVPADLVLCCGVLGRIGEPDAARLTAGLPQLCAPGATVIWTRHRRRRDPTGRIRRLLARAAFEEVAFEVPADDRWTVGRHRYAGPPVALEPGQRLWIAYRA